MATSYPNTQKVQLALTLVMTAMVQLSNYTTFFATTLTQKRLDMLTVKKIAGMWRCVVAGTKAPFYISSASRKTVAEFAAANNPIDTLNNAAGRNEENKMRITIDGEADEYEFINNLLPHGSGINCEWTIERESGNSITFANSYQVMHTNGYYVGWVDFSVKFNRLSKDGVCMEAVKIHGKKSHSLARYYDVRTYLNDLFIDWFHSLPPPIALPA